jgi:Predicted transcriptional regulator/sugar kinase
MKKINKYCTLPSIIAYLIFFTACVLHLAFWLSVPFSDFFNRYISSGIRMALAKLTGWFPCSFAELIVLALPLIIVILFVVAYRTASTKLSMIRYLVAFLSVVTLFYSTFVFGFAAGYQGSTLEDKLDIDRRDVSAVELYYTADILLTEANRLADEVQFIYGGSSVMPYDSKEMNRILNDSYKKLSGEYDFLPSLRSNVKQILLSEPMTYTHISGVYTYFTGEANINVNFPDYTIVYTAAHELAHQRGIAREDEANFMAFLVCLESDDMYANYCAYVNLYEYVANALYKADRELYSALVSKMDRRVRGEIVTYNNFFEKYKESKVSNVSAAINDTFLKSQGQSEGTKSYGRVVDLAVAYYR